MAAIVAGSRCQLKMPRPDAYPLPPGTLDTAAGFSALAETIEAARPALALQLNTGLDEAQTREMMSTTDSRRAVELVLTGMSQRLGFEVLPT